LREWPRRQAEVINEKRALVRAGKHNSINDLNDLIHTAVEKLPGDKVEEMAKLLALNDL
jgi:hypothetical protein